MSSSKNNFLLIRSNLILLLSAVFVGIVVSLVAQLFILSAKNIFNFFYNNPNNLFSININNFELNLSSLIFCLIASIIVCFLIKFKSIDRWHGPADTIYAAHQKGGTLDTERGFFSTIASFISISGGASVGIYGPLVHFGGTLGAFLRRRSFMPVIPHDIIIGSGVAAAISAGFGAPLAGIIFAHEVVLRHFSMKAVSSVALSSITASVIANEIGLVAPPFRFEEIAFSYTPALPGLVFIGICSALVALIFMNGLILSGKIAKKINFKPYFNPLIPGFLCGLIGCFIPEVLGLGITTVLDMITTQNVLVFLILLLAFKLFLTCTCIGFGLFGGIFSPALFLGASVGAIVFHLPFFESNPELQPIFVVAGMAALSSSVIGAPITAIILILELTGSYKYAIASIFPIVISTLITYLTFASSFFDKQLSLRGIIMSYGREHIMLSQETIKEYSSDDYVYFDKNIKVNEAITKFKKSSATEGYFIDADKKYFGKLRLIDIIDKDNELCFKHREKKSIIIFDTSNINECIAILTDFVGESVPIINKSTKTLVGIISENDVLKSYNKISSDIRSIEK
jgi:chloride channel protein, CIC family